MASDLRLLSDEEVFGSTPSTPSTPNAGNEPGKLLSDAEVFGLSPPTQPLTDAEVMQPQLPKEAGGFPGLWEQGKSLLLKGPISGFKSMVASVPEGIAGMNADRLTYPDDQSPIARAMRGEDTAFEDQPRTVARPITEDPLWKAGKAIEGFGSEALKPKPGTELMFDIGSGLGSVGAAVTMGILSPTAAALAFTIGGAGEAADRAVQAGATPEQIARASKFGNIAGVTDVVDALLPTLGTPAKVAGLLGKVGSKVLMGVLAEGGQEGLQQFIQNLIAKGIYKPDQDLTEGVGYNALIGGIVGGLAKPILDRHDPDSKTPTKDEIDAAFGNTARTPSPVEVENAINPAPPTPPPGASPIETLFNTAPGEATTATEPEILPPEPVIRELPNDVPSNVIDFLTRKTVPLQESTDPNAPMREDIEAKPGANLGRLTSLLGENLYGSPENMGSVTIKEMVQNSFDGIKDLIDAGKLKEGQISIQTDPARRTIRVYDNGVGMSPDVLANQFLQIAGTKKGSERASGGLGIAKMLILFANNGLIVKTMKDGKVARLATTGQELKDAMTDESRRPRIQVSAPTKEEAALFKDGHGTVVEVTVPEGFTDQTTGERKEIRFPNGVYGQTVLEHSPLFDNIEVSFNGQKLDGTVGQPAIGRHFPVSDYTQLFNVDFNWGTARVYVTKEKTPYTKWGKNAHVLSNGLWQFSTSVKKDPGEMYGENVEHQFYVDVNPKVKAGEPGYPFALDRQSFTRQAQDSFNQLFAHTSAMYQFERLAEGSRNFGEIHYLKSDGGKITRTPKVKIELKKAQVKTPVNVLKRGDKVKVVDGKLVVEGREIPSIKPEDMKAFKPDSDSLKVDQSEIDPNSVMVHDNVMVQISELEKKSIVQLGEEKFGKRFDEFLHSLGQSFLELRDATVRVMQAAGVSDNYSRLSEEAIGISFDTEYRGVSIRVPFSGSFINPAIPEFNDPLRAAVGMAGTMVHELAHHQVRSHNADFPAEMQRILIHLYIDKQFDFFKHMQGMVANVARNQDIFTYINGLFSGAYLLEPRGERLEDDSSRQAVDGGPTQPVAPPRGGPAGGQRVSGQLGFGARDASQGGVGGGPRLTTSQERTIESVLEYYSARNQSELGYAAPAQQESLAMRQAVNAAFSGGGPTPPAVAKAVAHTDEISWKYKKAYGLDRLIDRFMHITPLMRYGEHDREMRVDIMKISDKAVSIGKKWRHLGAQKENLAAFIDDLVHMNYRTPDEVSRGIGRHPTPAERTALARKHGLNDAAIKVFADTKMFFEAYLQASSDLAREHALRVIKDPAAAANKIDEINAQQKALLSTPYFPLMHFGRHIVTVKDAQGNKVFQRAFERAGLRSAESKQKAFRRKMERVLPAGHTIEEGILPEEAEIFSGLPPTLLNVIKKELVLTQTQQEALDGLLYRHSPAAQFAKRFKHNDFTPGYSQDFLRSFSRFAFMGARFYGRTKYAWKLREEIANVKAIGGNEANSIANYLQDHLDNNVLESKGDYGILKGAIFTWTFGFSLAGATLNMSQVPMISYPFLAAKFGGVGLGDLRAQKALIKAMVTVKNYYKKGSYEGLPQFEMRALDYGVKSGRISETQAAQLAALAQGENLLGLRDTKMGQMLQWAQEKAPAFFEFAEQFNRRVTYRAALDLAMKHPGSVAEREAMAKYEQEYNDLVSGAAYGGSGTPFTPTEARALVTAIHATEQTQFVYARSTRPRFMRGKMAGTLLVFQSYKLNVLQLLAANKSSVLPRFMVMSLLTSGMMGLPGADELMDIANVIGRVFFGKDYNGRRWLRELMVEMAGDKADVILHGLARRGFGLPALLDLIGEHPGRGLSATQRVDGVLQARQGQNIPFPVLDRSRAVGMGRLLPFDVDKVIDPGKDVNKAIADTTQSTSGAVFSVGFNAYKMLQELATRDDAWKDYKTYEKAMPRALSSASAAFRAYTEGRERGKGSIHGAPTIVNYDVRDTEQFMEVIARGLGYMPLRQTARWDEILMQQEAQAKLKFEQELLYGQWFEAQQGGDPKELDRMRKATQEYNDALPEWARGYKVSGDTIQRSIEGRARDKISKEMGVPLQAKDALVARHVQSLFPETVVDVRRVR